MLGSLNFSQLKLLIDLMVYLLMVQFTRRCTMQIRPLATIAAISALTLLVGGCATPPPSPAAAKLANLTKPENLPGKAACFWKSNFQGDWTVLNDSTLIVRAPLPKDAYVVKLFEPVFNLSFREGLGFEDKERVGQICNSGDDYILVPGGEPSRVPIVAVHALTRDEEDQLLVAAGLPVPRAHTAAQVPAAKNPAN
jgi:hypothetical protein